MIVKVQLPLTSTEPNPKALVYDRPRSFETFVDVTGPLRGVMKGRRKAFFHAQVVSDSLEIGEEAPNQDW